MFGTISLWWNNGTSDWDNVSTEYRANVRANKGLGIIYMCWGYFRCYNKCGIVLNMVYPL